MLGLGQVWSFVAVKGNCANKEEEGRFEWQVDTQTSPTRMHIYIYIPVYLYGTLKICVKSIKYYCWS